MFGKFNQNLVSEEYEPPAFGQIDQEKSRTKQIQEQRDRKELSLFLTLRKISVTSKHFF